MERHGTDLSWAERYLDVMDDVVVVVDLATGLLVDANAGGTSRLGWTPDEVVGRSVYAVVHPDDRARLNGIATEVLESAETRFSLGFLHANGGFLPYEVYFRLIEGTTRMVVVGRDISELAEAEARLGHLRRLVDLVGDILLVVGPDMNIIDVNPAACRIHEFALDEFIGKPLVNFVHPDGRRNFDDLPSLLAENGLSTRVRIPGLRSDGSKVQLEYAIVVEPGTGVSYCVGRDISTSVANQRELTQSQRFFELASDFLAMVDQSGRILSVNRAAEQFLQTSSDELVGSCLIDRLQPETDDLGGALRELSAAEPEARVSVVTRPHGDVRSLSVSLHLDHEDVNDAEEAGAVKDDIVLDGAIVFLVAHDVTEEQDLNRELLQRATLDQLTKLANRDVFYRETALALQENELAAVIFLDLDNFKLVNDTLGHAAGDELLRAIASRLSSSLKNDDVVSRLGGDEFAVLLRGSRTIAETANVASRIRDVVAAPFVLEGRLHHTSCSLGVALGHRDTHSVADLLREADTAAYRAKERGRNRFEIFDDELRVRVEERFELEAGLRSALAGQELDLDVQAIFEIETGLAVGVEALVRWNHPIHGRIGPSKFLEVAGEAGLLESIDNWMLEESLTRLGPSLRRNREMRLGVNLVPDVLTRHDNLTEVIESMHRHDLPPDQLVAEVSETFLSGATPEAISGLQKLCSAGFSLAIDNFGTGTSSLGHLRDLPIDSVKIDRSLVATINHDVVARTIIQSVVGLAGQLGFTVVAEGVESVEQFDLLAELGCQQAQGYLRHRPVPMDRFDADSLNFRQVRRGDRETD